MNVLSKILKELAQEFKIPDVIGKNLFWQLLPTKRIKNKEISEKGGNY